MKLAFHLVAEPSIPPFEKEPLKVRLEPLGTVTGRLVDSQGKPAAGTVIAPSIDLMRMPRKERRNLPGDLMFFAGSFALKAPARHTSSLLHPMAGPWRWA